MCSPAPVINQLGRDMAAHFGIPTTYGQPGSGGVFLGSVGDQAHSYRRSSHNCAGAPGGQESGDYAPQYAHAWDARPSSHEHGMSMVRALLRDDRVRYVIFDSVGYKPDGDTWSTYHPTFHVSLLPGTHDDVRQWFGPVEPPPLTTQLKRRILAGARRIIATNPRPRLRAKRNPFRGKYVREVQRALGIPETGTYGPGTRDAVEELQRFLGLEPTGAVDQATWVWIIYMAVVKAYEG